MLCVILEEVGDCERPAYWPRPGDSVQTGFRWRLSFEPKGPRSHGINRPIDISASSVLLLIDVCDDIIRHIVVTGCSLAAGGSAFTREAEPRLTR